jgi:hypothetical protein
MPEFPDETELHDTGQDGLQRFRKPLLYPAELRDHAIETTIQSVFCDCAKRLIATLLLPFRLAMLV